MFFKEVLMTFSWKSVAVPRFLLL